MATKKHAYSTEVNRHLDDFTGEPPQARNMPLPSIQRGKRQSTIVLPCITSQSAKMHNLENLN
ncbi:uncharacterized protein G2W53_013437 [Senna tora]|uniref:Uncharacterized protein n=1 Tax=Senna tora TaxID=362788 RepID=A0A834U4I0_9FABA|nr:uncharacterized protein G2W53_013437 [Senna tora]